MAIRWIKRDEARGGRNPEVRALIARYFEADIGQMTDTAHFVDDLVADWLDHLELLILHEGDLIPGGRHRETAQLPAFAHLRGRAVQPPDQHGARGGDEDPDEADAGFSVLRDLLLDLVKQVIG